MTEQDVYIVDGLRTPYLRALGKPNPLSASDLAVQASRALLLKQGIAAKLLDEVILGCVGPYADEANIARIVALRLGCATHVPAYTVQRNCGSGMQALDSAANDIRRGRSHLVLAGGTEAMSRSPFLWQEQLVRWIFEVKTSKSIRQKLKMLGHFKPRYLSPIVSLLKGLTDATVGMNMGQTAEKLAYQFHITRAQMDAFAQESHVRSSRATKEGLYNELFPVVDFQGNAFNSDNGIREGSSVEKLNQLKPVFERPYGLVTAGNSSQITDGAAMLLLASEKAVKEYKLSVLGRIKHCEWAALDPTVMGLGPVYAIAKLMNATQKNVDDIGYWEINEAFAAQVLACLEAMSDEKFCSEKLNLKNALGVIPTDKLNVDGGAIALGHPVGSSGARIVLHLLHVLARKKSQLGVASLCVGGGQGGAMLVENLQ